MSSKMEGAISDRWSDLPRRALTIAIGAPLVLGMIYLGFPFWNITVLVVGVAAAVEIYRVMNPKSAVGLVISIGMIFASVFAEFVGNYFVLLLFAVIALLVVIYLSAQTHERFYQSRYFYLLLASIYIGIPVSVFSPLRALPNGLWWTFVLFSANWTTDTLALVGGRIAGRRKLAPSISAGKTVEGAVIGFISGVLVGILVAALGHLPLALATAISLLTAMLTIIGDLIESATKRYFHVKDSGTVLPGHGGILDRVDGLVLATVPVYLILLYAISIVK